MRAPFVHVGPDVTLLAHVRRTRVQTHAHPDGTGGERRLCLLRRLERARRGGEGDEDGVPLRVDLHATMGAESRAQDAPMLRECLRIRFGTQLVQQPGRTLHVGEQEGDRAGGQVGTHGVMMRQGARSTSGGTSGSRPGAPRRRQFGRLECLAQEG